MTAVEGQKNDLMGWTIFSSSAATKLAQAATCSFLDYRIFCPQPVPLKPERSLKTQT